MMNIAIFCSGNGSNFQAIVDAKKSGLFDANIALMVCDNKKAYAIERATSEEIKTLVLDIKDFDSKVSYEAEIIKALEKHNIDLICLAGYMRLLLPSFINKYKNRILNIHPALLPSFKGMHAIKDALSYGVKQTGVTVHFVNEDMDTGPIILQEPIIIEDSDTEKRLTAKIHELEHRLYPRCIKLFLEGKVKIEGRTVRILP